MVERRLRWLALVLLVWGAAVFQRLFSLQVFHHGYYANEARKRQELTVEIPGPRGTLFDRTGQVLAMSVPSYSVHINPLKVDLQVAADILSGALHLDRAELYERLVANRRRGFLWIKRHIEPDEYEHLSRLNLDWIDMERESRRCYPNGSLAAHVLGSVNFEEKGDAGIEKALNAELQGQPGIVRLLTDVKRRGIDSQLTSEPRIGTSITTTLDSRIQFVAERAIAEAVQAQNAASGSVVVMDPHNGDVLALASYPTYDPNVPPEPNEPRTRRQNHAIEVPFEPGSVFKTITLSAALETTNLRPESPIDCHGGVLRLPGRVIHDSHAGLGVIPMALVLAKSSNIGAIMVGMRVGQENMYEYVRRFGFGQKTGIQLPAESRGKLRKLKNWGTTSLASVSMGQEVSVTTVQLAQAASVIANGGLLVHPRLVLKRGNQAVQPELPVRVIKPDTAITMRQMMEGVVLPGGTGTRARLAGYTVGGKTGSAQIFDFATHHYTHSYNGSFVGFSPLTNPAIVIVVTLNGTHGTAGFGGAAAAPVFHIVGTEAMRVLDVPKDLPEELPAKMLVAQKKSDEADLADADTDPKHPNILEDGEDDERPAAQIVAAVAQAPASPKPGPPQPTVPNFAGKTMRAVLAEATAKGLYILPAGSGVARAQFPPPGAILQKGERIRVQFAK